MLVFTLKSRIFESLLFLDFKNRILLNINNRLLYDFKGRPFADLIVVKTCPKVVENLSLKSSSGTTIYELKLC